MAPTESGGGGEEDFAALLAEYDEKDKKRGRGPAIGDMVKGRVVSIGAESVFVDLGGKAEGVLEREQLADKDGTLTVKVGDTVEARVVDLGGKTGSITLRKVMAKGAEAKAELVQAFEHRIPVEGLITGVIKGGVEVQVAGVRAFCPAGQLDNRFVEDPAVFVGERYEFRITKLETGRGGQPNLVLSRRVLLQEAAEERATELRKTLEVGSIVKGTVVTIKDYGAFVDIGGIEGMLHVSELGFQRVRHPSEVLSVGSTVEVQVTKMEKTDDPKRPERISLSLKALERDPWSDLAERFPTGARIKGVVTRMQPFGAFVEVAPGIEGLVHVSQLVTDKHINHPREVVELGKQVDVTVLGVDLERRRLSLSMSAGGEDDATANAEDRAATRDAVSRASGEKGLGTLADLFSKNKKKR
jgi:small subunit ribosomal protein S1